MLIYADIVGGKLGHTFSLDEESKYFISNTELCKLLEDYLKKNALSK